MADQLSKPKGWNAFADNRREWLSLFRERALTVSRETGSVDGMLCRGGLDSQGAERELALATGEPTRTPRPWGPVYVRGLANRAVWPALDSVARERRWAIASARAFLETARDVGATVHFTY